jgi:hypothetical protein
LRDFTGFLDELTEAISTSAPILGDRTASDFATAAVNLRDIVTSPPFRRKCTGDGAGRSTPQVTLAGCSRHASLGSTTLMPPTTGLSPLTTVR